MTVAKRVVSRRGAGHCPRAADAGGSVVAELPDRTADSRNRVVDTGRAATRAPGLGVLSHCRNYAWQLRRPRRC
jgi:hypothetical protein